jgi:hypothetical protein
MQHHSVVAPMPFVIARIMIGSVVLGRFMIFVFGMILPVEFAVQFVEIVKVLSFVFHDSINSVVK